MKKFNWSNVDAVSDNYATPPAGGYVLCICDVEDVPSKEYLKVFYDIIGAADPANAQFEGYYGKRSERSNGKIPLPYFFRSYKQSAVGFFKAFLVALEKSGNNFSADNFDGDEKRLKGMCVGAVLGQEEYVYEGKLRIRLKVDTLCSIERITSGDFKIPECKRYEGVIPATATAAPANNGSFGHSIPVNDEELPF